MEKTVNINNNDLKRILDRLDDIYLQINILRSEMTDLKVRINDTSHKPPQTSVVYPYPYSYNSEQNDRFRYGR